MASLERLSEVPELLTWFREGLRQEGATEEEIELCVLRMQADARPRRAKAPPKRIATRGQLAMEVDEPELEWPAVRHSA